MLGYTGLPLQLLAKFPSTYSAPTSVGYTLLNNVGTTHTARSTDVYDLGNGAFSATTTLGAVFNGIIKWDCTKDAVTKYAFEDLSVIAGLATEVTQLEILNLLTIPDYVGPVIPTPAPASAGLQALYGIVVTPAGALKPGVAVKAALNGANHIDNEFLVRQQLTSTTDVNGQFVLYLVQGVKYIITIPDHGKEYAITVTAFTSAPLSDYLVGGA